MSTEALQTLQFSAITLACLSGLFGVYSVLVVLAIWATYRHATASLKGLRWVTIALFMDLFTHFVTRCLQFARARHMRDTNEELLRWTIPLIVVGNVTMTTAAFLSDGTLAWRFYVVFNKKWALYLPAASVILNALLCWSADGQHLAIYSNEEFYKKTLLPVTLKFTVAWGWSMFFANSLMTGGIIYKITWANRTVKDLLHRTKNSRKYVTALRAVIESALATWIGILLFEIASLAPAPGGHVTTHKNVGYVQLAIMPIFFGISQSLITARLGIARETHDMDIFDYYASRPESQRPLRAPAFNVFTNVTTTTDSQDFQVETEESKTTTML